ncbi:MAG: YHS domain-containing protein [Gammaproteobacteria bacterium]|nr:YHS domain-containing protein [Gammaproteobacteria bacterium]
MKTDPVCGMTVTADSSPQIEHDGETYYFCSEHCQHKFQQSPKQYLHQHDEHVNVAPPEDKSAIYTCPMHPEIEQHKNLKTNK